MNQNRERLKALVTLFDLSLGDIARTAGVSRPLISRLLSGDDGVTGTAAFARLEKRLGELIEKRRRAFFYVASVEVSTVKAALASVEAKPNVAA